MSGTLPGSGTLPLLVLVSGAPGAGKTTLGRTIGSRLALPFLSKDELKEVLGTELGEPADVPASQRLGAAAYGILYAVTRRILEAGGGAVVESNLRRGQAEPELRPFLELADVRLVHCSAADAVVVDRYAQRYRRGERHPVHLDAARADGIAEDLASGRFEPLDLDVPALVVATDAGYEPGLEEILSFLTAAPTGTRHLAAARA